MATTAKQSSKKSGVAKVQTSDKNPTVIKGAAPTTVTVTTTPEAAPKKKTYKVDPLKRLQDNKVDILFCAGIVAKAVEADKDALKQAMLDQEAKFADGEYSVGQVSTNNPGLEIDPQKFLKTCKTRGVKDADAFNCVKIGITEAKKLLGEPTCKSIGRETDPKAPSLSCDISDTFVTSGGKTPTVVAALKVLLQFYREREAREAEAAQAAATK